MSRESLPKNFDKEKFIIYLKDAMQNTTKQKEIDELMKKTGFTSLLFVKLKKIKI